MTHTFLFGLVKNPPTSIYYLGWDTVPNNSHYPQINHIFHRGCIPLKPPRYLSITSYGKNSNAEALGKRLREMPENLSDAGIANLKLGELRNPKPKERDFWDFERGSDEMINPYLDQCYVLYIKCNHIFFKQIVQELAFKAVPCMLRC